MSPPHPTTGGYAAAAALLRSNRPAAVRCAATDCTTLAHTRAQTTIMPLFRTSPPPIPRSGGVSAAAALLRSNSPAAVRCAATALATLSRERGSALKILCALPARAVVLLCRSSDFTLQSACAALAGGLSRDVWREKNWRPSRKARASGRPR